MYNLKNRQELMQILQKTGQFNSLFEEAKNEMVGVDDCDIFTGVHPKTDSLILELVVENPKNGDSLYHKEIQINEFQSLTGVSPLN